MMGDNKTDVASTEPVSTTDGLKTSDADATGGIKQADPIDYAGWNADPAALARERRGALDGPAREEVLQFTVALLSLGR